MANYTDSDWSREYQILIQLYPNQKQLIDTTAKKTKIKGPIGKLWDVTNVLSNKNVKEWSYILRKLGYEGFIDNGGGAFSQLEYPQSVFFTKQAIEIVELIHVGNQSENTKNNEFSGIMNYNNDLTNAPADVKSNPKKIINYLSQISKKYPNMEIYRWVEVEPIILKNVDATIQYMIYFLKGKEWKQGQQALQNIPGAWDKYVQTNFRLSKSKNPSKPGFGWFDTRFKKD